MRYCVALAITFIASILHAQAPLAIEKPEAISFPSGKLKITGWLVEPSAPGRYPLILVNPGGVSPAKTLTSLCQMMAKQGYVAIATNYRGVDTSEGQGEFAKGEVDDVLAAMNYGKTRPKVNPRKVGMLGFSHGGIIAYLAASRDPSIKAIVPVVAPTDLASGYQDSLKAMELNADFKRNLEAAFAKMGGPPDKVPEAYRERSALFVADKIKCEVLMIHGAKDPIVSVDQGQRMEKALKAAGNEKVTLIVDPDMGHQLVNSFYTKHGRTIFDFFARTLKEEKK